MEAAQFALRFNVRAQRFYQRKLAKSNNNTILARKTVAHKLARACYYIMRDLVPFDAMKAFG
jgi:transposase